MSERSKRSDAAVETAADTVVRIRESAEYIRERFKWIASADAAPDPPKCADKAIGERRSGRSTVAVVLGSGLGGFADRLHGAEAIPYGDIPHFPRSTAPGHKGRLVSGAVSPGGKRVICMQGRFHLYEGYSIGEVTRHIRVLRELGATRLILTNACGGMEADWSVGDLMLITDHINYMSQNPLTGPNLPEYGPRFPDMSRVYNPVMNDVARRAARELSIELREGVYVGFCGPSYETPAEIRMFRALGASAVGMSTVPEAIVANHCGIMTCGISCVTNYAAGTLDQPLTESEVIETAGRSGPVFERLIGRMIEILD
jgi:purine-nucleoside phosphorylase